MKTTGDKEPPRKIESERGLSGVSKTPEALKTLRLPQMAANTVKTLKMTVAAAMTAWIFLITGCAALQNALQNTPRNTPRETAAETSSYAGKDLYTGDGGKDLSIMIAEPETRNFVDEDGWISVFVQGVLTDDFTKYSRITVVDKQNMDRLIAEQQETLSGNYSDENYISAGSLTIPEFILAGSIIKMTENTYDLELAVTRLETGERRASFRKTVSVSRLRQGLAVKEASAGLLEQLGVELTPYGKKTLLAASNLTGGTALAKGIAARNEGLFTEAFSYYFDSASSTSDSAETIEQPFELSSEISNGALGAGINGDIEQRKRWLQIIRECAAYFKAHPPFEIIYNPELKQTGATDYNGEKVNLALRLSIKPVDIKFKILNEILTGLNNTGRRSSWGLGEWPITNIEPYDPSTVLLGEDKSFDFQINVSLYNGIGRIAGKSGAELKALINFDKDNNIIIPEQELGVIYFTNIKTKDVFGDLTVKFTKINNVVMDGGKDVPGYISVRAALESDKRDWEYIRENTLDKIKEDYVFNTDKNGDIIITEYTGFEKNIKIPQYIGESRVYQIGDKAFYDKGLTGVIIPYGINVIGSQAFEENNLSILKLPASISTIGRYAFRSNPLKKITLFTNISVFEIEHITHRIAALYYKDKYTNRYVTYYEKDGRWRKQFFK
ncbi:MAG: leucine-rich repeat domain-containing protein [Spirochaetaceae bacterium]|jgi:hypothetical protein|nr:leucine-rich repeat domain-containing protein [Spirochaetaceae bacterium]